MQQSDFGFKRWVGNQLNTQDFTLVPLKGDASFRSYYRATTATQTYIVMWAPPPKEQTQPFVNIARGWQQSGLQVPTVWAWEPQQGFVLLSDFGDVLLEEALSLETVDAYYHHAMQILLALQLQTGLPAFNEAAIRLELSYFQEWFLAKFLKIEMSLEVMEILEPVFNHLFASFTGQPQVAVHRDFHCRNLMVLDTGTLGIIDFQDAVTGPITYDLVSLLKDCYIDWESAKVNHWVKIFYEMCLQEKRIPPIDYAQFLQWFDWVGLQRHLKVLGIFARLHLRDNKPQYLQYLPRIMNYVLQVTQRYPEFYALHQWLQAQVVTRVDLARGKVA